MSYNGGPEDSQSWPFSVRYTASPYRKSKFPVDTSAKSTTAHRDNGIPFTAGDVFTSSSLNNMMPQVHSHWLPSSSDNSVYTTVTDGSYRSSSGGGDTGTQSSSSSVINPNGLVNRCNNNDGSSTVTTSASAQSHQLGSVYPLHQVVPHHQVNQPLFAQALVNYHNAQNNSSSSNSSNFRHNFHNSNNISQHHHHPQRQLQFQRGEYGTLGGGAISGGKLMSNNGSLPVENSAHLQQQVLRCQQNHDRQQRLLQTRLLLNSSNATGAHLHPYLIGRNDAGPNTTYGVKNPSTIFNDHHNYGLPIGGVQSQPLQPGELLGTQLLSRKGNSSNGNKHLRHGNAVWHLLTDNKGLDQVEGLDEGYIEDLNLKQPFPFPQHLQRQPPHLNQPENFQPQHYYQQINSIKTAGVPNLQHQQTTAPFPVPPFHRQQSQNSSSSVPSTATSAFHNLRTNPMAFGAPPQNSNQTNSLDYDPYSYVYDSHIHQNDFTHHPSSSGSHNEILEFNAAMFHDKVISRQAQPLSNPNSLHGLSLKSDIGGLPTTSSRDDSDEDVSENEYEEIQEVARYMNSVSLSNNPENDDYNLLNKDNECGSSHPNYDDVGATTGNSTNSGSASNASDNPKVDGELSSSNSNCKNENGNSSNDITSNQNDEPELPVPPIGPPRHFKSFSSTDDILAEVVQVHAKHDRVLDQLNLEVENLLIRSTKQEIEQNELNCQRSYSNTLRQSIGHLHNRHYHRGDWMNPGCDSSCQSQASGSGTCQDPFAQNPQQQAPQMYSGSFSGASSSEMINGMSAVPGSSTDDAQGSLGDRKCVGNNSDSGSCNCCCCCGYCSSASGKELTANGDPSSLPAPSLETKGKDRSSWRESLKTGILNGFYTHSHHPHHHSKPKDDTCSLEAAKLINGKSSSVACITDLNASGTFSRKKKLDRNAPGQLSDTNLKHKLNTLSAIKSHNEQFQLLKTKSEQQYQNCSSCTALSASDCAAVKNKNSSSKNMTVAHSLNHHILRGRGKGGYQRSNSLIPSWKIRDHLMRLPFLRQHKDKQKKGEGESSFKCSLSHPSTSGGSRAVSTSRANGDDTVIPKSVSGADFSLHPPPTSSALLLGGYNENSQQCSHHHPHHLCSSTTTSKNHSCCIISDSQQHQHSRHQNTKIKNTMSGCASKGATAESNNASISSTTCSSTSNNPNLKLVPASSMDELRPTEEHWYSADSDTEPDSLTAIIPPPTLPQSGSSNTLDNCCDNSSGNNPSPLLSSCGDLSVKLIDPGQKSVKECACCSGDCAVNSNGDSACCSAGSSSSGGNGTNTVGNIYTNSPNGVTSTATSSSNHCGGGGNMVEGGIGNFGTLSHATKNGTINRMDVVSTTIIPDAPKAPKFRRGTQGLKDKWRESWSHSKTMSKNNMEDENRLLRWFSLRKNSTTFDGCAKNANNLPAHSTLPQLTEEDLRRISFMEDEEGYWPRRTVQPPSLPPPPADLSSDQITRRHIIAAIVHSENSYVAALQRLVNEYKKPLECSHPAMLSHSKISAIFHRVPEILQCHSLFRIALAECVRKWDSEEKIGDVFVASFSKSLVLDVYSEFINNFGTAMETAKLEARRKSAFAEFLKVKQMTAHDRLSLFGLMVKPVQRFPQFILLLQDLLKHTPRDHHDRMSLQLALTQLESLAAMLNERKRESEQYQAFKETIKSIGGGKFVLLRNSMDDSNRILLRQDIATQLEFDSNGGTVAKSKCRKLLLLNDMLICTSLPNTNSSNNSDQNTNILNRKNSKGHLVMDDNSSGNSNRASGKAEKCMFKWSFPVREVDVEDLSISPTMSRFVQNSGSKSKGSTEDTASLILLEEMQSLMYDYEVLSRILTLVQTLKSSYEGLTEASVKELMLDIQHQIQRRDEQISYFDSSCLTLLLGSGSNKEKVIFQMQSPQARNEWIEELRLAQLALDPSNSPAWDIPLESPYPLHKLPLFVRSSALCSSPHLTTVKCGCYFTHTFVSQTGRSKILDYLWVSSTDGMSSHITAYRSQQNTLKEVSSFDMIEEKVNDLLFAMGHIWMGTESRKILVYDPSDSDKGSIRQCVLSESVLKLFLYNNVIYAALADGNLAVFAEIGNTSKALSPTVIVKLGQERITSIFGSKNFIYAACGNAVVTVDTTTHTIERNVVLTHHNGFISHMACSGVGLWIATHESGTVCLYHLESLQHLQDVSIAPSAFRTVRDSFRRAKGVHVTSLMAHKGWLWIGTNLGVILTIPLPRLEGVPIISTGNANVSFHGFLGPVTFVMPLSKAPPPLVSITQQKHHNVTSKHHHQHHSKETKIAESKDDSYITMSSPVLHSSTATKSPEPVVISSDDMANGELCLSTSSSSNNVKIDSQQKSHSVSFSNHTKSNDMMSDGDTKGRDESVYVNATENETDSKPDSLPDSSLSSFNPIESRVDDGGGSSVGSDKSSSNSMERGVTPPVTTTVSPSDSGSASKTLVVLRKKSSKDNVFLRNCKTLPRGGPTPSRFSIESDVYGLYGNLINVRGLEDEGRFVDPLYDALRRSDPELNSLDAKISTLDRRLKMRMSRPRSLDLSNWSVDSKISASSDESVGLGSRSSQQTADSNNTPAITNAGSSRSNDHSPVPGDPSCVNKNLASLKETGCGGEDKSGVSTSTHKKTMTRQRQKSVKGSQDRTVLVVVGGRGYFNMRTQTHPDHFVESESKCCTNITLWQMKT